MRFDQPLGLPDHPKSENFAAVFRSLTEARQPPSYVYTDNDWYRREKESLFLQAWHFAGLASDLSKPGQYLSRSYVGTSVVIVRGDDNELRAFFNTCRHRGAPLTEASSGQIRNFVCPFHRWSYRLDGRLFRAPGLADQNESSLAMLDSNLIPLPCEIRENLIFVHLSPAPAMSLDSYLGDYIDTVARPHAVSSMRCVHHRRYELEANWKLYAEVDMETLHTPHVHRRSIGEQPVEIAEPIGQWIGVFNRAAETVALAPDRKHHGLPYARKAYGLGLEGTHFCIILPGFFIVTAQDCMWWIQKTPVSATRVEVDVGYCFPEEVIETDEFKEKRPHYIARLDQVIDEDDQIVVYQQRGLNDRVTGCYTPSEEVVHQLAQSLIATTLRGGFNMSEAAR